MLVNHYDVDLLFQVFDIYFQAGVSISVPSTFGNVALCCANSTKGSTNIPYSDLIRKYSFLVTWMKEYKIALHSAIFKK